MSTWRRDDKLGMDFETSGSLPEYALQPWRKVPEQFWATSLVYMRHDAQAVMGGKDPTRASMTAMLRYAIEHKLAIVGWNLVYDIQVLIAYGLYDLVLQCRWLDSMLLWKHATVTPEYDTNRAKKKHYGLKLAVAELWPDEAGYDDGVDFQATDPEAAEKRWQYNIKDVIFTLGAAEHWWGQLLPSQQRCAQIEAQCLPLIAMANFHGMVVDTPHTHDLALRLRASAKTAMTALAAHGVTEAVLRSPVQLSRLMFTEWGLPVIKRNKTKAGALGSLSTDKETLHELGFLDERAKQIRTFRESVGNRTKFADALLNSADYNGDGRTRPQAFVFSTYSGRLTYASKQGRNKDERPVGFALHQEKRGKEFRDVINPPVGYDLAEFDAAGQEFKWMAVASGDPTMLHLCAPGNDPHSFLGARIANMDYFELMVLVAGEDEGALLKRRLGKVGNLSLQYRTGASRLRSVARVDYNIPMDLREAGKIHDVYQRTYPGVVRYWDNQIVRVKQCGFAETFAGRRVQIAGDWNDRKIGWSLESSAINYPIQGTGADQKYLALMCLKSYCQAHGVIFAWDLHDGLYFYIPKAVTADAVPRIKHILDNLPYKRAWGVDLPIPMTFDAKVGPAWGSLRKWEG